MAAGTAPGCFVSTKPSAVTTCVRVISLSTASARRAAFASAASDARQDWSYFDAHRELQGPLQYSQDQALRAIRRPLEAAELGCFSSHFGVWQWFLLSDHEQLVVLEDDVVVDWAFIARLSTTRFAELGLCYLRLFAKNPVSMRVVAGPFLDRYHHLVAYGGQPLGTQGYLLTRDGARRLVEGVGSVSVPIDFYMDNPSAHSVDVLGVYPYPLFERFQPSSIGDGRLGYRRRAHSLRTMWSGLQRRAAAWYTLIGPWSGSMVALRSRIRNAEPDAR